MNRIEEKFADLKARGESALVGFVTAGDPDPVRSFEILEAMCGAGIDILELGIPFSDPTADGPVIQRSSARALKSGIDMTRILEMTERLRGRTAIPIILFSYYNPILAYGTERFNRDAMAAGADGALVVDLPPEESPELTAGWDFSRFSLIRLIAPTTPASRMKTIAEDAAGFLYMVSKTGVTGSAGLDTASVKRHVAALREATDLPVCVGFGVSTAEDVAALSRTAEGVVIGSAFERLIEENLDRPDLPGQVAEQTRRYKAATRRDGG
jgi:tryptophan synthase alpha chain